jgi:hypothetical protein
MVDYLSGSLFRWKVDMATNSHLRLPNTFDDYVEKELTRAKHLSSSFLFSRSCSSNGYLYLGKGAIGQSKLGISSL